MYVHTYLFVKGPSINDITQFLLFLTPPPSLCHEAHSNSETKEPQIFEVTQLKVTIRATQNCC